TCYGKFAAYALLNYGGDFKRTARELAQHGYGEQRQRCNDPSDTGNGSDENNACDDRPAIIITTDEHLVNDAAVAALARDSTLYQRAGLLVRIVRDTSPAARGVRRPLAPRIEPLPAPLLRERLAANA